MDKIKILIECETYVQTAIETYDAFKAFEKFGEIEIKIKLTSKVNKSDIMWCDILYSIRSENLLSTYFAKMCKKNGRLHIVLLDDYLFKQERKDFFMRQRQKELGKILNITDVLFSPSQILIDRIKKDYKVTKTVQADTAVESVNIKKTQILFNKDVKRIVYYSNDGSNNYFKMVMMPILDKIVNQQDFKLEIHCIGMQKIDSIDEERLNIKYVPHLSLKDFRTYLETSGFCIGLAPLVRNDGFSEYKYFNKFIPGIYSNAYPYISIIEDGENGILCDNEKDWIENILLLLEKPNLAVKIANKAQEQLKTEFSIEEIYKSIKKQLPEFVSYRAPQKVIRNFKVCKFKYYVFCFFEKINSVYRVIKKKGIKGLVSRTRQYFILKNQTQRKNWV